MLEHHADVLAILIDVLHLRKLLIQHLDLAALGLLQLVEAAQQGRLAGAGWADDTDHLALFHVEGNVPENHQLTEYLSEILYFND